MKIKTKTKKNDKENPTAKLVNKNIGYLIWLQLTPLQNENW